MNMMIRRVTEYTLVPDGEPLFSESAFVVRIEDDAGGEFIVVRSANPSLPGELKIDADEWPAVKDAVDELVKLIKLNEKAA